MLTLVVEEKELFNERTGEFIQVPKTELHLEHSLISLSRWESKWKKPFLNIDNPTPDEMIDYICCMSTDKTISHAVASNLTAEDFIKIRDYISDPRTATTVADRRPKRGGKREVYTSELLYYYMTRWELPTALMRGMVAPLVAAIRGASALRALR